MQYTRRLTNDTSSIGSRARPTFNVMDQSGHVLGGMGPHGRILIRYLQLYIRRFFRICILSTSFKCSVDFKPKTNDMAKYLKGFRTLTRFILRFLTEIINEWECLSLQDLLFTTNWKRNVGR